MINGCIPMIPWHPRGTGAQHPAVDSRAPTSFSSFNICTTVLSAQPALINGNNTQVIAAANSWMLLADH